MVRINEILKTIGGANLLAAPSRAQLDDPRIAALAQELLPGANGMAASDRSEIFRVAWDFIGSALGSRNELYERHYLGSPLRTHTSIERFYSTATRARGDELLEKVLADNRSRQQR
jgi:aromatic ring hydroxylase